MDDGILLRALAVALAAGLAIGLVRLRRRPPAPSLRVEGNLTGPGVYLFTAAACDACDRAREACRSALGENGFTELTWEEHSDLLTRLQVGEIPVAALVDGSGRGVAFFPGVPRPARLRRAARRLSAP